MEAPRVEVSPLVAGADMGRLARILIPDTDLAPPSFTADHLEKAVLGALEKHSNDLARISHSIWSTPELGYREFHAVSLITDYIEQQGYKVTRKFCDVETSFLGEYKTPKFDSERDTTIVVLCEYDALPELGHACGHNLIAEAGLATFLAVVEVLKGSSIEGRMLCMGTPAEEVGGGKVLLVESGAFKGIDFAMMSHPAPIDVLQPDILGIDHYKAEFFGKAAHASCGPWEGINALDAVIAAYSNVSMLRQQLQPGHQVHMVITKGGAKPNIIPEYTRADIFIRAPTVVEVDELRARILACLEAGAEATGCRVECGIDDLSYSGLMSNKAMLSVYKHYGEKHGMYFPKVRPGYGSTDMGNVSTVVPSMHPIFGIGEATMPMIHTKEFRECVGKPGPHKYAQRSAMAMAMTTLELFHNPDFRKQVRHEFRGNRVSFVGTAEDDVDGLQLPDHQKQRRRSSRAILIEAGFLKS